MPSTPDAFLQSSRQVTGRFRADQAPAWLALALLAAGCEVPNRLDVRAIARDVTGASAEARLPPPGLDRPSPNLAAVPPIPERPELGIRQRITEGLAQAIAASATPLPERRAAAPLTEPEAPGQPPVPARPPAPPRLSRAAPIPWTLPAGAGTPLPGPAPGEFPQPGELPAAPAPELLAPGAPPSAPPPALLSR